MINAEIKFNKRSHASKRLILMNYMQIEINLTNIAKNFRTLRGMLAPGASCGASVKANAYGLGAAEIIPLLHRSGCRDFFLSNLTEGLQAREYLLKSHRLTSQAVGGQTRLYLLHGISDLEEAAAAYEANLTPVLNSYTQLECYSNYIKNNGELINKKTADDPRPGKVPLAIHIDSGMHRLGLDQRDFAALLAALPNYQAAGMYIDLFMSHLACADDAESANNSHQLRLFTQQNQALLEAAGLVEAGVSELSYDDNHCVPDGEENKLGATGYPWRLSLANSNGITLGKPYHFDLVRPGIALYGGITGMLPVVRSKARIIQKRSLQNAGYVGYNATKFMPQGSRIFTLECGYADGLYRALQEGPGLRIPVAELEAFAAKSNISGEQKKELLKNPWILPFCGKISMDLAVVDASTIPDALFEAINSLEILGENMENSLWELAHNSRLSAYEILVSLSQRYPRRYHL